MTQKELICAAKLEVKEWEHEEGLPMGLAWGILWPFIYRVTNGRSVEQDFFDRPQALDYQI